jgi:hypothetical protein
MTPQQTGKPGLPFKKSAQREQGVFAVKYCIALHEHKKNDKKKL